MAKLDNRCANCGGKFGLVYHHHWGLRFCRKVCKDDFLAKTARMRKWFGWTANQRLYRRPVEAETENDSSCSGTGSAASGHKLISYTSVTMGKYPIATQDNPRKKTAAHLLALVERGFRSVNKVDYLIRRWIVTGIPVTWVER
jgi:hypothetical protein